MASLRCQCTQCPAQHEEACPNEADIIVLFASIKEGVEVDRRIASSKTAGVAKLCFNCFDATVPGSWEV